MGARLEIIVEDRNWKKIGNVSKLVEKAVFSTLKSEKKDSGEVTILLTNDKKMQQLNYLFRGKNKTTNVLSFNGDGQDILGEIALGLGVIKKEAKTQGKKIEHHIVHLLVHGILHLLGYDHTKEDDAEKMEKLEIKILKSLKIKNPYEV